MTENELERLHKEFLQLKAEYEKAIQQRRRERIIAMMIGACLGAIMYPFMYQIVITLLK